MIFCNKNILYICVILMTQKTILQYYNITYTILVSFFCNIYVINRNQKITNFQEVG